MNTKILPGEYGGHKKIQSREMDAQLSFKNLINLLHFVKIKGGCSDHN